MISHRSYTDQPESMDMEALTLTMKSTGIIIVGLSDEFCEDQQCKGALMYLKVGILRDWLSEDSLYTINCLIAVKYAGIWTYGPSKSLMVEAIAEVCSACTADF